jgi:hydroxymethylbilane synthase
MGHFRIATRKSPLALWQAQKTHFELTNRGHTAELVPLVTTGDKLQKGALADVDLSENSQSPMLAHHATGKGLFVKEIQEALLTSRADIAVHSMKDLPVAVTPGLVTAIVLPRAHTEDVLIFSPALKDALLKRLDKVTARLVDQSPEGLQVIPYELLNKTLSSCDEFYSKPIGTISARRQSLLWLEMGSSLMCEVLRGNVDSRLMRVARGEFSAIVLARAGLDRLQLFEACNMYCLPPEIYIPAPAQGAIAIECRETDIQTREALAPLACAAATQETALERLALWMLGGDCHTAIGAHCISPDHMNVYCHSESVTSQTSIKFGNSETSALHSLRERERGYFNGYFESLKKSPLAFSLYSQLRDAHFETLVPLGY